MAKKSNPSVASTVLPLLPFMLFTSFFLLWPILAVVLRSLQGNDGNWTIENYRPILQDGPYSHAFLTSIKLSVTTALTGALLGAFFAIVLIRYSSGLFRGIIDSIAAVFANSGGVPLAFMFVATFGIEGIVTRLLKWVGWDIYSGHFTIFSYTGVVMVYTFFQVPLMVLVFKPALEGLRQEWSEASRSLGASHLTYVYRIVIPVLTPSFIGAFFLLFAGSFSAYATARALTVGTVPLVPIIIGTLVDGNVVSDQQNLGDALAVGMIVVASIAMSGYIIARKSALKWQKL